MSELQLDSIFTFLFDGVNSVFSWFESILQSTHMLEIVIGVIVLLIFWRMVISPMFTGHFRSQSDSVQKNDDNDYEG